MKKKILILALSAICLALLLGGMLAANADTGAATDIPGHNLALEEGVHIVYYVDQTVPAGADAGVLCWEAPQESYTLENKQHQIFQNGTYTRGGNTYARYELPLPAKKMTVDIYAVSYVKVGDTVIYSELDKYSVLQYCYNKKGSTSVLGDGTATLGELVTDILNYGKTAQKYFNYNTSRLANADYYQINVVNGTLEDGTTAGLYQKGESISLKAAVPTGATFFYWKNSAGTVVGKTAELAVSAPAKGETYTAYWHPLSAWIDEIPATESAEGTKGHYHCDDCGKDFDENYNEIDSLTILALPTESNYSQGLLFTSNGDGTCIVSDIGTCTDSEIVIPPISPAGDSVTDIEGSAFYNCRSLTSITIPDSVTSIDASAFYGCSSLMSVTIPDNVTNIGKNAFYGCPIETATMPASAISSIPKGNLKTVVITSGTSIEKAAFSGYTFLTSITIPDSVTSIGASAFSDCSSLTSITIPGSVTWIGSSAFSGCSSLASANIPNGVTLIFENTFYNCSTLTNITIPDSVTSIGVSAFSGCTSLKNITIPDSVTSVESSAFSGCPIETATIPAIAISFIPKSKLKTVVIINGTYIKEAAFFGCSSLEHITIPFVGARAGITASSTYQYPFGYLFGARNYTGGAATQQYYYGSSTSSTTSTTYYIPSTLKSVTVTGGYIPYGAFFNCSGLTSISIGGSVTSIGSNAFAGCSSLESVYITDLAKWCAISFGNSSASPLQHAHNLYLNGTLVTDLVIPKGVKRIGGYAFHGCSWLTGINIPNSVTSIGNSAFYGCTSLTSITIPDSVTSIGSSAFCDCSSLTSVTIPDSVTSIENSAFCDCSSLTSVTIPDSVTSIGNSAFSHCTSLTSITIPDSVTSIGSYAFSGCTSLASVYITDLGKWCVISFSSSAANPLYNGASLYLNGELVTDLIIPEGVSSIKNNTFYGCISLTNINIPNSVTSIGNSAFYGCTSLTSATIGNSVTSVEKNAFSYCAVLTSIAYQGTKAQWIAISKDSKWDFNTGNYTIYCTNGNITK